MKVKLNHSPQNLMIFKTALIMDALYFHAARQSHENAMNAEKNIKKARQRWTKLDKNWKEIEASVHDLNKQYDLLERIAIQLEDADYEIGKAYGAQIKEIAIVHILSCAALESHINFLGKEKLTGREYDLFDRFSLEAKWLFLPKYLGNQTFKIGQEPLQSFSALIRNRDKLVHFKSTMEEWQSGEPPKFITTIGLTINDSKKAIKTVIGMINTLSEFNNSEPPYWLKADLNEMDYFDFKVE